MFKKLLAAFGGSSTMAPRAQSESNPAEQALLRLIAERGKSDPLIGAKLGSKEVTQRLLSAMTGERGVHIESLLTALGALAGYACQAGVRAQATARGMSETALLVEATTADGKKYYFGDHLNSLLAESQYSVWSLAAGAALQAGCSTLLNVEELFKHASETVGLASFGVPRAPAEHVAHELPVSYVRSLWPAMLPTIQKFCPDPEQWPVLLGLCAQEAIAAGRAVIDPCIALRLVMESAVPMSKIDLGAA